jgi:hypothetical protein
MYRSYVRTIKPRSTARPTAAPHADAGRACGAVSAAALRATARLAWHSPATAAAAELRGSRGVGPGGPCCVRVRICVPISTRCGRRSYRRSAVPGGHVLTRPGRNVGSESTASRAAAGTRSASPARRSAGAPRLQISALRSEAAKEAAAHTPGTPGTWNVSTLFTGRALTPSRCPGTVGC